MTTSLWESLDNAKSAIELDELNGYTCDNCGAFIDGSFYHCTLDYDSLDYCEQCWENVTIDGKPKVELQPIDRTETSIEDKPKIWKCRYCDRKMGGGDKWFYNQQFGIDVCQDCHEEHPCTTLDLSFIFIDMTKPEKYYISDRSGIGVYEFHDVPDRTIPKELEDRVTEENMQRWSQLLDSIVDISDTSFGSLKQWAMIDEIYELPIYDAETSLLVDCSPETNGRIASLVEDNHGRIAINIIFDNLSDFLEAEKEWNENKLSETEMKELETVLANKYQTEYSLETDDLAKICAKFSGYIRLINDLPMYYG